MSSYCFQSIRKLVNPETVTRTLHENPIKVSRNLLLFNINRIKGKAITLNSKL